MLKKGKGLSEIGEHIGRSEKAVRNRCHRLHIDVCAIKEKQRPSSFSCTDIRCPFFYGFSRGKNVKCEGLSRESYVILGFSDEEKWAEHVRKNCNKDYEDCRLYRAIEEKYN